VIRHPDGSVTVTYKLEITRGRKGQKQVAVPAPPPERPTIDPSTVPRITRMLVLGYHFERLVREGKVKNYAEIARLTGLSRARIAQLVNLTLLPADLQESLLPKSNVGQSTSTEWSLRRTLRFGPTLGVL
jgi:hypothetical protein